MTYSSIVKSKPNTKKQGNEFIIDLEPKKAKSVIPNKMYNGKFDRVKYYQYISQEWKKSSFLANNKKA